MATSFFLGFYTRTSIKLKRFKARAATYPRTSLSETSLLPFFAFKSICARLADITLSSVQTAHAQLYLANFFNVSLHQADENLISQNQAVSYFTDQE